MSETKGLDFQASSPKEPERTAPNASYRAYVLLALIVVYTFNFIDRQIMGALAIYIQPALGVNDTQMSLMRGLAFALFYTGLGVPVAWLADRTNRVWIMTGALTVWSGMTALCGVAANAWQLFLARMGVGIGEAGGVGPAYSIVSDYFPPHQRARALAIYSFGVPLGSALGIIFAGVVATVLDWRAAFIIIGLAGVAIAPIFRLTVREPQRGQYDSASAATEPVSLGVVFQTLLGKPSFWLLCVGAAFSSMVGYGLFAWMPSLLVRSYADMLPVFFDWLPGGLQPRAPDFLTPAQQQGRIIGLYATYFYGTIVLIGGTVGIYLGGMLADWFGKTHRSAYALVPAFAFLVCAPVFLAAMTSGTLWQMFALLLIPTALSLAWLGPVLAAFQHIVTPNMRATASAVFLLINNLVGIALGDLIIGATSDLLRPSLGDDSLKIALMIVSVFYVIAAGLLFLASRTLRQDWEE